MLEVRPDILPQDLALAVEKRGFESLFFPEHSHIPCSRETIRFGQRELPDWYSHLMDPFVALSAAATVTERIKLGTCVCLIPEHDPIVLAKTIATLDVISRGRVLIGIGAGWNAEELRNHGVAFADRWKVTRERVLAMREIWTHEEAVYHGEFVDFDRMWLHPKPVQRGGPPILLGAQSRWAWGRVAEYCDGWLPSLMAELDDLKSGIAALQEAARKAGRSPDSLSVTVWGVQSEEQARDVAAVGVDRLVFRLETESAVSLGADLDAYAKIARGLA